MSAIDIKDIIEKILMYGIGIPFWGVVLMTPGYIIGKIVVDSKPDKWTQYAHLWVFGAVAYYGLGIGA